jgi:hypothetical protein
MAVSQELKGASEPGAGGARVRFRAVGQEGPQSAGVEPLNAVRASLEAAGQDARRLRARSARIETACRFVALLSFLAVVVAAPAGLLLAHIEVTGSIDGFRLFDSYGQWGLAFALVVPAILILMGRINAMMAHSLGEAQTVAAAAQSFIEPDKAAIRNVEAVGAVVRGQMDALNAGIDDALIRLASVEAMIRQHVGAIEQAGLAIENKASGASAAIAAERARLMELTETLNARADEFATAIAEKAQANILSLQDATSSVGEAEARLDERLATLERAAGRALQSFEALSTALLDADGRVRTTAGAIETSAAAMKDASERAARIADAAADTAARNAANVGQFSLKAAEDAKKNADAAIEVARVESERAATTAVEFTTRESRRVAEAAARAVDTVREATMNSVAAAASDAERAAAAANLVTDAAKKAMTAAREASAEVAKAGEFAQKNADDALAAAETASKRVEERNKELAAARAALEAENARLESLIDEQRKRADRLAEAIATQTERLSKLAENQLREQEAAARLAEAQAAIEKTRAAEAQRAAAAETARLSAESERLAKIEAEKRRAEAEKHAAAQSKRAQADPERSNVLELGKNAKAAGAARLDAIAADIEKPKTQRPVASADRGSLGEDDDKRSKHDVSWREILSATDGAEPLDLGAEGRRAADARASAHNAMKIIAGLQDFTLDLETRLYGEPPPALLERFERGDRNVFANRLLRLNESDVKRRIRAEGSRDKTFERGIHDFLQGFERLLEDATTSETADEELEQYLSSPLGRVYLLVGATVGYFA